MRSRRSFILLGLFSTLVAAGCRDLTSPGSARSQLDTNRQKWQTMRPVTYTVTVEVSCFCGGLLGPVRTEVRGDSIVTVTKVSDGQQLDAKYGTNVEQLFQIIDQAIARHSETVRVTYDKNFGYPVDIYYDGAAGIADDEFTCKVSDFTLTVPLDD